MRNFHFPGRSPVMAPSAMVSTSHPLATQAGIDVLKSGVTPLMQLLPPVQLYV